MVLSVNPETFWYGLMLLAVSFNDMMCGCERKRGVGFDLKDVQDLVPKQLVNSMIEWIV